MGLLSNLMSKIFSHAATATPVSGSPSAAQPGAATPAAPAVQSAATATAPAAPPQTVDIAAILNGMAAKNPEKLDWKRSIVDLMKLFKLDSSLGARKELAKELGYTGALDGSAEMNVWLHREVMIKLAESGGKVPEKLKA